MVIKRVLAICVTFMELCKNSLLGYTAKVSMLEHYCSNSY